MDEVGGALISIALVLTSVFVPTMFLEGISGEFFRQFAVVISVATLISAFNSLSLSPALAGLLLKGHDAHAHKKPSFLARLLQPLINGFNGLFDAMSRGYATVTRGVIRIRGLMLVLYAVLIGAAAYLFIAVPRGFVPAADQGYVIALVQLPSGSSLQRSDEIVREIGARARQIPGVNFVHMFPGRSLATGTQSSSAGVVFVQFEEFEKRRDKAKSSNAIQAELNKRLADISGAQITVIAPPTIRGIGASGGFSLRVQDLNSRGPVALEKVTQELLAALMSDPRIMYAFTPFGANAPEFFVDVDRTKAEMLGVPVQRVHETLEGYLGSAYVNDFNLSGRTYQVIAQAEGAEPSRRRADRPPEGQERDRRHGAAGLHRHVPHAERAGSRAPLQPVPDRGNHRRGPGYGQLRRCPEPRRGDRRPRPCRTATPSNGRSCPISSVWPAAASSSSRLRVVFVFLVLAAQYESWSLPLAIILIVPMCLLVGHRRRHVRWAWTTTSSRRSALSCSSAWRPRTPS